VICNCNNRFSVLFSQCFSLQQYYFHGLLGISAQAMGRPPHFLCLIHLRKVLSAVEIFTTQLQMLANFYSFQRLCVRSSKLFASAATARKPLEAVLLHRSLLSPNCSLIWFILFSKQTSLVNLLLHLELFKQALLAPWYH